MLEAGLHARSGHDSEIDGRPFGPKLNQRTVAKAHTLERTPFQRIFIFVERARSSLATEVPFERER